MEAPVVSAGTAEPVIEPGEAARGFEHVFDSQEPTVVLDRRSMLVLAANPPLAELAGRKLESILGVPIDFLEISKSEVSLGWQRRQDAMVRREDGSRIPVEVVLLYMQNEPLPIAVVRLMPRDRQADEPKQLENRHVALRRAHEELLTAYNRLELLNDQLDHRNRELREVYRRLSHASKMAAVGELVAGTAHGINNPLAAAVSAVREMSSRLGLLVDGDDRKKMDALCSRADRALERIEGTVADLKRLARAGTGHEDMKTIDLQHEVRLALDLMSHRLRDVKLDLDVPPGIEVRVSPDEFGQVIMNLVDNAVQAMAGEGHLAVRARAEGQYAVVEVEDDGPGIPDDLMDRIFEPFFSTKSPGHGSGIGLSVARGIIEGYAGIINASGSDTGGALFVIRLPREVISDEATKDTGG